MEVPLPRWLDTAAYPFAHRWLEPGPGPGRLHYVDEGAGPPVLFVHGTPTWSFDYRHLIAALRGRHRCVAPDHLGFGLSDRPPDAAYTPEAHAARLARFADALDLRDVTLVVHDFGGPIGLPLALEPGRVRRLVVLNSWMWSFDDDRVMAKRARAVSGGLGRFLYRWLNFSLRVLQPGAFGDRRQLTRALHRQYLAPFEDRDAREQVLWALARALLGSGAHYRQLWERRESLAALPALILWGMKDPAFPPRMLARWREALPAAEVVELPAAGHWPQEEAPEEVLRALAGFLAAGTESGRPADAQLAGAGSSGLLPEPTAAGRAGQ